MEELAQMQAFNARNRAKLGNTTTSQEMSKPHLSALVDHLKSMNQQADAISCSAGCELDRILGSELPDDGLTRADEAAIPHCVTAEINFLAIALARQLDAIGAQVSRLRGL